MCTAAKQEMVVDLQASLGQARAQREEALTHAAAATEDAVRARSSLEAAVAEVEKRGGEATHK